MMDEIRIRLSRRTFLAAGSAALLATTAELPGLADKSSGLTQLANGLIEAFFDVHGLISLRETASQDVMRFADDGFAVTFDEMTLDSASLPSPKRTRSGDTIVYTWAGKTHTIHVVYQLRPGWRFVTKQVIVAPAGPARYHVKSVTPFQASLGSAVGQEFVSRSGAFVRFGTGGRGSQGLFFAAQNPFAKWRRAGQQVSLSYAPDMDWQPSYGPFIADRVCMGPYTLSGQGYGLNIVPQWQYVPGSTAINAHAPLRDYAEWKALTDCVRAFLIHPPEKSVRIDVGWCQNDYQIDVATPHGQDQYRRILAQASAVGCPNVLYAPANSLVSSKAESTDAWGWENLLWLGMGEQMRKGAWNPAHDAVPASVRRMQTLAAEHGVSLVAYVYPSMKWRAEWNAGDGPYGGANSASHEFQDWLVETLVAFQKKTGVSGYSFDYWLLGYKEASDYAQWHGCRRVLETLRQRLPALLIDGRQSYQNYGPWTWLAGSYPHPTTTDEQPESFRAFPDLHIDRVYGNHQRWAAWWYRMENFCPTEILPGFLTHQTQRFDAKGALPVTDFRLRDWDYLGWKYSVISSIATAPMNHVLNYLPARDESEFQHFSAADKTWLRGWLDWTDLHRDTLRQVRPIIGQPMIGHVDGTAAIVGDRGFLFLFNPNARAMNAEFNLDASLGLTHGKHFTLTALYPRPGVMPGKSGTGVWAYGDTVSLPLEGAQALVLELAPALPAALPRLQNAPGTVSVQRKTVIAANVSGPVGHAVDLQVVLPPGKPISALTVNGAPHKFTRAGETLTARVRFAGSKFDQLEPLFSYDPAFTGGTVQGTFTIPGRIFAQLRRRKAAWPIPYTEDDRLATWLAPERLLLHIQIADPKDAFAIAMTLDGAAVTLQKAYTSIYPQGQESTFVGWYVDVSALAPDVPHAVSVTLPPLQAGQFQGVFFENVETEYTTQLA